MRFVHCVFLEKENPFKINASLLITSCVLSHRVRLLPGAA